MDLVMIVLCILAQAQIGSGEQQRTRPDLIEVNDFWDLTGLQLDKTLKWALSVLAQ
jgi:hypothetical protein